ncbi:MAG: hypothetical protein ACP5HK_03925 [Acidilobus sp.]
MLVLVYHDPGGDDSLVHVLASRLNARAVRVSELSDFKVSPHDVVVLLMPMRGGHYSQVAGLARARGARFAGRIPPEVTASAIARAAASNGCGSVRLHYWPAERCTEDQLDDVGRIAAMLTLRGLVVVQDGCADCTAPLALLPGRIAREAEEIAEACRSKALGPLASVGSTEIEAWLRSIRLAQA